MVTFMKQGPVCDSRASTNRLRVGYLASAGQLGDRCLEGDEDDFLTSQTIDVGLMGGPEGVGLVNPQGCEYGEIMLHSKITANFK